MSLVKSTITQKYSHVHLNLYRLDHTSQTMQAIAQAILQAQLCVGSIWKQAMETIPSSNYRWWNLNYQEPDHKQVIYAREQT
jgi:hypothetical protein